MYVPWQNVLEQTCYFWVYPEAYKILFIELTATQAGKKEI